MTFSDLAFIPLVLIIVCSTLILVQLSWRRMMIALAVQYLAAFWLVGLSWPVGLSLVKLLVGMVVCVVLGSSSGAAEESAGAPQSLSLPARLFRGFTAALGLILVFRLAPGLHIWLPAPDEVLHGGLALLVAGLLQLGMNTHPGKAVVGLLTVLSGFEVLYAALESSVLVAGLLAVMNLGLVLVASYAIAATAGERSE
jgi:hypothetical protein